MGTIVTLPKPKTPPPLVRICTPYRDGLPDGYVALIEQVMSYGIPGYEAQMLKRESTVVTFARNSLSVKMEQSPFDYLFFIDDDNVWNPNGMFTKRSEPDELFPTGMPLLISMMKKILDHRLPICCGVYVARQEPYLPMIYEDSQDNPGFFENILDVPEDQLIEVAAAGTGFMCIHREVLGTMEAKSNQNWDRWQKRLETEPDLAEFARPKVNPPFWFDWRKKSTEDKWEPVGEDIFFCDEARKLGYKIMVDTSVKVPHKSDLYVDLNHYNAAFKDKAMIQKAELQAKWAKKQGVVPCQT